MSSFRLWQYGIPFIIFVVGGSFGLREFTELRYRYQHTYDDSIREGLKKQGIEMKPAGTVTLESEYEKLKEEDLDNWENIRIQRPWKE